MANIYKIRLRGRGTTKAGSTISPYLTGNLVGISWPGRVGTSQRYSTGSPITLSVLPRSSQQAFWRVTLGDKTTGKRWYPTIRLGTSAGAIRSSAVGAAFLPLSRDRIRMNWAASTDKTCAHLDLDLLIDGPPGLMGATDYNN